MAVIGVQAYCLKQASRSPNPAQWNYYSAEANEHLYGGPEIAVPRPLTVVAHAGGGLPELTRTNSLEALDYNYQRGHRLFELDFSWTSDMQLAAVHDWKDYRAPSGSTGEPPTLESFSQRQSAPVTPTTLFSVYQWLERHPGAFIVTDAKKESLRAIAKIRMERPELVHRFIPQIYQFKDYDLAVQQGYRNIILTLYRCLCWTPDDDIVEFARGHRLFAVTMPVRRCLESELASRLARLGVPVYAHTVNDADMLRMVQARGALGVYSDVLLPAEVARNNAQPKKTVLR